MRQSIIATPPRYLDFDGKNHRIVARIEHFRSECTDGGEVVSAEIRSERKHSLAQGSFRDLLPASPVSREQFNDIARGAIWQPAERVGEPGAWIDICEKR